MPAVQVGYSARSDDFINHDRARSVSRPQTLRTLARVLGDEPGQWAAGCMGVTFLIDQQVGHPVRLDRPGNRAGVGIERRRAVPSKVTSSA